MNGVEADRTAKAPVLGGPHDGAAWHAPDRRPEDVEGTRLWTGRGRHLYRFHTGWRELGWQRVADGSYVRTRVHGPAWLYQGPVAEEPRAKGGERRGKDAPRRHGGTETEPRP